MMFGTTFSAPGFDLSPVLSDQTEPPRRADGPGEAASDALRERAADVREAEVEMALATLSARTDLTDAEEAALREMADRIVDGVMAEPDAALARADDDVVRCVVDLFDLDVE